MLLSPYCDVWGMNNSQSLRLGLELDGAVYAYGSDQKFWKYTPAAGWAEISSAILGGTGIGYMFFIDSQRNFWFSGNQAVTNSNVLHKSTDLGETWAASLTLPEGSGYAGWASSMAEDSSGNLYTVGYSTGVEESHKLAWKSEDYGENWDDISGNFSSVIDRHTHLCGYDQYRDVVWITHGDAGASSPPMYSTDEGATFSDWDGVSQSTGITVDDAYIYIAYDTATDRSIYRATQWGGAIELVYSETDTSKGNFWAPQVIDGMVIFPIGGSTGTIRGDIIASADHGNTWRDVTPSFVTSSASLMRQSWAMRSYLLGTSPIYGSTGSGSELYRFDIR
jgi:hypothetical protein